MPGRIAGLPRAALPPTRSIGLVDTSGRPSSSWSPSLYPGPQSPPPHTQQTLTADAIGVPRAATLRADPTCSSPRGSAGPPPPPSRPSVFAQRLRLQILTRHPHVRTPPSAPRWLRLIPPSTVPGGRKVRRSPRPRTAPPRLRDSAPLRCCLEIAPAALPLRVGDGTPSAVRAALLEPCRKEGMRACAKVCKGVQKMCKGV